jgi:hypothetical protein
MIATKICAKCHIPCALDDFRFKSDRAKFKSNPSARPHSYCIDCSRKAVYASRKADPESTKATAWRSRIKLKFGMTEAQFNELLRGQQGRCAICAKAGVRLDVDHCHLTGRVRSLLCMSCNSAVAFTKESLEIVDAVRRYVSEVCLPIREGVYSGPMKSEVSAISGKA